MKIKVVPPVPDSLDRLRAVQAALPVVPDAEESCCVRLARDGGVADTETAREWLPFLRALGLAESGPRGYGRVREDPDPATLAARFREGVYAADEAVAVVESAGRPVAADEVFERLRERVPAWERGRSADWRTVWRQRTKRVLGWAALFRLVEQGSDGFTSVESNLGS